MVECPVCSSRNLEPLLHLAHQPIFQHPVSNTKHIKAPYFKDLDFFFCKECEHSFQKDCDVIVLEKIYQEYYYTPRPSHIGIQFQEDFMQALMERFDAIRPVKTILEVGCSSAEILKKIEKIYPDKQLSGCEPNTENADRASASGFCIYKEFFGQKAAQKIKTGFDMIFHRHVIEHVFNFDDFFKAHHLLSHKNSVLVVETPCLNWAVKNASMAPFHVEHAHVFSIKSLKVLLEKHSWYLKDFYTTDNGHLITLFTRNKNKIVTPTVKHPEKLKRWIKKNKEILKNKIKEKKIALWGAGSGGIKAINYFNLCPDVIVDSNPAKVGKKFVGFENLNIAAADIWLNQEKARSQSWIVVVASTYHEEIYRYLEKFGWEGEMIRLYSLSD